MNSRILGYVLGVLEMLVGIWYFEWTSWNHIFVSSLLFLGGIYAFLTNARSQFLIKTKKFTLVAIIAVILLFLANKLFIS